MFLFIVLTVLNIFGTGCQSENVTISIDKSGVMFGNNVTLTCIYDGNRTESGIYWYNGSDTTGLFYLPSCTRISTPSLFYDTGRIFPTCNPSSNVYTLTITVQDYDFGREWCCSFSLTPNVRCSSNTIITGLTTTTTTASSTSSSPTMTSEKTKCQLELGLGLGLGFGIPSVITCFVVVIFIYTAFTHPYILGLGLGLGIGITFLVGWIIIASLISTGNECKLELGLGLGLGSGMPNGIACIIGVIFTFFMFSLFKGIPNGVELGKGILTGILIASLIGIIVVYLIHDKLKPKSTCIKPDNKPQEPTVEKPEQVPLKPTDKKSKTNNSGPPVVHTENQNKVEPNTIISKQTNYRHQHVPPAGTGFEYRPQPPPPQNGEIKDQNLLRIHATIEDTLGRANETHRANRLLPLPPNKAAMQEEDTLDEPKKKRKKRKKKNQMNEENRD